MIDRIARAVGLDRPFDTAQWTAVAIVAVSTVASLVVGIFT